MHGRKTEIVFDLLGLVTSEQQFIDDFDVAAPMLGYKDMSPEEASMIDALPAGMNEKTSSQRGVSYMT
jgi:hypothetical protein